LGNTKLDKDVKKNNWRNVLDAFHKLLGDKKIPCSRHLGDLIKRAILTIGTRVSKDVPKAALIFFGKLVKEYPLGITDKPTEYYCSAFTNVRLLRFCFVIARPEGLCNHGVRLSVCLSVTAITLVKLNLF
jgi:hypothetical protein